MWVQCLWEFLSSKGKMVYAPRMDDPHRQVTEEGVGVENSPLAKFCRDVPAFLRSKGFKRQVDLIHARHKSHGMRGLTRDQFAKALVDLGVERFTSVEHYRRCRGPAAKVLMFITEFVFHVRVWAMGDAPALRGGLRSLGWPALPL